MAFVPFPVPSCYRLGMRETTKGERSGIQWTLFDQLEDLDFTDDLVLLSYNHEQMQAKTAALQTTASRIGLKINNEIEDVTSFTYSGHKWRNGSGLQNQDKKSQDSVHSFA